MDKIEVKNLKIVGRHGVFDFERSQDRTFELDLVLFLDLGKASKSDNLEDTIDYAEIIDAVIKEFTKKNYNLIEAVAESIISRLFKEFNFNKVKVRIRKPHAPIDAEFDTVQVELERENDKNL
tara:strand:- start:579 stop:947 length:369 start_codon:yes stop_codon:yes gene_type:complete